MISGRSLRSWSHRSPREAIGANGPPSPRLAPGGFYEKGDWLRAKRGACPLFQPEGARNTGSRGVARANRAGVRKSSEARKAKLDYLRASGEQDARSERPARWHGPPRAWVR
jgi:hypothetical protein